MTNYHFVLFVCIMELQLLNADLMQKKKLLLSSHKRNVSVFVPSTRLVRKTVECEKVREKVRESALLDFG